MSKISVLDWITAIADRGREILDLPASSPPDASQPLTAPALAALCAELMSQKGEAAGTALAREVVRGWEALSPDDRVGFFERLVRDFSADRESVLAAAAAYEAEPGEEALLALNRAAEPRRQELIRRINMAPGGTRAIVDMREALLGLLKEHRDLAPLDADMEHLLTSWFNRGFLELRRIDWKTSADVLEKLIRYEAVHEIRGWDDLRRRLARDRRCFAFFHPAMPDDPLIFVQVALVHGLADSVQALLAPKVDETAPTTATTAIFYSISNCQNGLRGISFGNFLIKQVVEDLRREFPTLKSFATLSPIPGFMGWLRARKRGDSPDAETAARVLDGMAAEGWHRNKDMAEALRAPALRLCARYLAQGKRGKVPLDPVARFHLGNGATLERLDWLGDVSAKGMRQSGGMMVNYAYHLPDIERNHEALVNDGRIAASRQVLALAG